MTDIATEPFVVIRTVSGQPTITRDADGLNIEGYVAVFRKRIQTWDPWNGDYEEEIAPGAFAKSIAENTPIMLFNHGRDVTGGIPVGVWTELREDKRGLLGRGRMFDNDHAGPVRDAIEGGALTGQSFMAEPLVDEITERAGRLPLLVRRELRLMEAGPVTWPAYSATTVTVRSLWTPDVATSPREAGQVVEPPEVALDATPQPDLASTYAELARVLGRRYPSQGEPA